MQEEYGDISDLNYMGLAVPADGTIAVVADGCATWAPAPDLEPDARGDGERWLPMCYEAVLSADGKILDVVAWCNDDPSQWWLRTGRSVVLGAAELERVSWTDLPCVMVSSPAGWRFLQRSPQQTQAICILDWQRVDTNDLFDAHFGTIICTSAALEQRLQARATACGGARLNTAIDDLG